ASIRSWSTLVSGDAEVARLRRRRTGTSRLPPGDKEATLPDEPSKERAQAERLFKKTQKAAQDETGGNAQYEADARALRKKSERLKALRLARDATGPAAATDDEPSAAKPTPPTEPADR